MPQEERMGFRDLTYSRWHRLDSIKRFLNEEQAQLLWMIDLDASPWVEWDDGIKEPMALIETARASSNGLNKPFSIIQGLARRTRPNIPAYVVLYTASSTRWLGQTRDIDSFRVKRVWPNPRDVWETKTPSEYAQFLIKVRQWSAIQRQNPTTPAFVFEQPNLEGLI